MVNKLLSKPEALWEAEFLIIGKLLYPRPISGEVVNKLRPSFKLTFLAKIDEVLSSLVPSPGGRGRRIIAVMTNKRLTINILYLF